jgi:hypothetical protein
MKELPPILPKNEHDTAVILHALKLNFLFQYLNKVQRKEIVNYLKPMSVLAGDIVVKQGDDMIMHYISRSSMSFYSCLF